MGLISVNWVRFAKIFIFVYVIGMATWVVRSLFIETRPAAPASLQLPTTSLDSGSKTVIHSDDAALLVCIGDLDNKEWTEVLSDSLMTHMPMVHFIDAATDSVTHTEMPISGVRDKVVTGVRSRADFARIMYVTGKLSNKLDPPAIFFVGSPVQFNALTKNVAEPTIASHETLAQVVGQNRSIVIYHTRPSRKDDVMQHFVDELISRSKTVREVYFK